MTSRIRLTLAAACLALGLIIGTAGAALAANPSGSGQPSASCGSDNASMFPPGFLGAGFANADLHFAHATIRPGPAPDLDRLALR